LKNGKQGGENMSRPTPDGGRGKTTEENGEQYFIYNNVRIKITEHFSTDGKQISELITELIEHKIKEKAKIIQ